MLGSKYYENIEYMSSIYEKLIHFKVNSGNIPKAIKLAESYLKFGFKQGGDSKIYVTAIASRLVCANNAQDLKYVCDNADRYEKAAKAAYGKKSIQYIAALKDVAFSYICKYKGQEAYKLYLEAYDIAKEVFGSEENQQSSTILVEMSNLKMQWGQFEEACNMVEKAKKIEEKVSSKYSVVYKHIDAFEKKIKAKQEQVNGKKKK
jgi:tetratricopeptide (TPR) repeat protein